MSIDASLLPMPGEVACGTVVVPSLAGALPLWTGLLEHEVVWSEPVCESIAASWGAPAMAGCPQRVLRPASGASVYVRLIESPAACEGFEPTKSYGWAALEITVQDVDSLHERLLREGLEIVGPPKELEFTDRIYPMQVMGTSSELLYLNEIRGSLPEFDLPTAGSFVDKIFIAVLAVPSLEDALAFYEEQLGLRRGQEYELPYGVINRSFGLPEDCRHRLATTCFGRRVSVEVDQYPDGTVRRPCAAGHLPGGIASVGLALRDLGRVTAPVCGPRLERLEPPYDGRSAISCRGASGEWLELIEQAE